MKLKLVAFLSSTLFLSSLYAEPMTTKDAVNKLQLTELAEIYSPEKIKKTLGDENASPADALLIDIGVISLADLKHPEQLSAKLQHFIDDYNDPSENYLGNISDKNIIERIVRKWNRDSVIEDKQVLSLLNNLIDKGYTQGYNVVNVLDDSHFKPELTICYGHNDIKHAIQLIYLMKSEGFDPKVQFITKSSAFLYLPEWGKPSYPVVTLPSGKMIAVVKEYNLDFEFETADKKAAFMSLIKQYAKKESADQTGLIYRSWWQPFYRSYTELSGYLPLKESYINIGNYRADLLTLPERFDQLQQQIIATNKGFEINEEVKVSGGDVWVNPSFYRYMLGNFK